jgi:hypothetical protein
VWDPAHRVAAELSALASTQRRHLQLVRESAPPAAAPVARIELPGGDFDVATPDLAARYDSSDRIVDSGDLG